MYQYSFSSELKLKFYDLIDDRGSDGLHQFGLDRIAIWKVYFLIQHNAIYIETIEESYLDFQTEAELGWFMLKYG